VVLKRDKNSIYQIMAEAKPLKFLIIDGYTKEARNQLQSGGASLAADLYKKMLLKCSPVPSQCDIIFPADPDVNLPSGEAIQNYHGIAWTGCSSCVYSGKSDVNIQIEFARECFRYGVPAFGSCWAAQIAVVAAGGKVELNPKGREMGIARDIQLTSEGSSHPLYIGKQECFDAFTSHDDEITLLPDGGIRLSGNEFTSVQSVAVSYENSEFWAVQYHPEYDLHEMARLMFCRMEKLIKLNFFKSEREGLAYIDQLELLHNEPSRSDIASELKVKSDISDDSIRTVEVKNWINHLVLPSISN